MKKLPWRVERKKEILKLYRKLLNDVSEVKFFNQDLEHTTPWFIDIFADDRDNLIQFLKKNSIGSRVMYPPINKQRAYNQPGEHVVSEKVGKKGLWLPSASQLANAQIEHVCNTIREFYDR